MQLEELTLATNPHTIPSAPYPRQLKDSLESYPISFGLEFKPFLQRTLPTCNFCQDSMHQEVNCHYYQLQLNQPHVDFDQYKGSYRICRLCNAAGHGAFECNWTKFGSNYMLERIKSLNGKPPCVPTELFPINNDTQSVIGYTLDNFWIAQDGTIVFKEALATITLIDRDISNYGECNVPVSKVIDAQKGDREYTNQDWYRQHLLHGCWKLSCPYIAVNYHPSQYEPQVHPELDLCIGLLRGPNLNGQSPIEVQKWM